MDRIEIQDFVRLYNDCMCSTTCYDVEIRAKMKSIASDMFDSIPRESVSDLVCMYMLTRALVLSVYSDRDDACSDLFYRLIPPYMTSSCRMLPERLQMDILRCIVFEMGNSPSDAMYERCVNYYETVCMLWLSQLDSEDAWVGMDLTLAMERIQLIIDGIEIFDLSTLHDKTARAYEHYHNLTT